MATFWRDRIINQVVVDGAHARVVLLDQSDRQEQLTVIRAIFGLTLWHVRDAIGEQNVSIGLGLASAEGSAIAGGAGVANAAVETDFPLRGWMFRSQYLLSGQVVDQHSVRIEKDIRAMRKMENGVLYLSINSANLLASAFDVHVTGIMRFLMKTA